MTDRDGLRALLTAGRVTHVPGVWDAASAALAVRAGHRAVLLSAAAVAATMLARPGLQSTPATQIADRAATFGPALDGVPLLADADLGYDSRADAVWTALSFARAGISGLHLTDGDNATLASARITEMVHRTPEVVVIARASGADLGEIIARARRYAAAGADAVLPEGVDDRVLLGRVRAALPGVPLVVCRAESGTGPSDADLVALGVPLVLHPMAGILAALRAASLAYRAIADTGDAASVDQMPPAALAALLSAPEATFESGSDSYDEPPITYAPYVPPSARHSPGSDDLPRILDRLDRLDT